MYTDTITVFNRYHSKTGDMWFPHVLKNVHLIIDHASITAKYGSESKDNARLFVKYEKGLMIGNLPYKASKEWQKLTNDKLGDYITFNYDSNYFDFFIVGEYSEDTITDSDYTDGFYEYMENETECYALTSCSNPYKIIPHFEILAR